MPEPIITFMNEDNSQVLTTWHLGTIKTLVETETLTLNAWNNRGGATDVSDLVNVTATTTDINGGTDEEAVTDLWTYVCVAATASTGSGGAKEFTQVGGTTTVPVAADGATDENLTNAVIKGTANDGSLQNSKLNYANIKIKVIPPLNASAGAHSWRLKLQGYYS